jgi:radical SAM superfamily enzyme YgiQ (UPF0313 family)
VAAARRFKRHVASFVADCVEDLLRTGARVVGFSSTFSQNVPSLLVAKLLKARAPEVTVVLGGSNCEGVMGAALHRAFPWVDVVVRGEGERVLPRVVRELLAGRPAPALPGVCRRLNGESVAEPEARETIPMGEVPEPTFDDYFESLEAITRAGRPPRSEAEIAELLGQLVELRLAIHEDGRYLTLAIPSRPRELDSVEETRAPRVELTPGRTPRSLPLLAAL